MGDGLSLVHRIVRTAFPSRWRVALADRICNESFGRLIGRLYRDRIPASGLHIRTDAAVISPRTKAQLFMGIYEGAEIRFVQRFLRPDLDVVELGASIGVMQCHIARAASQARRVCVEANPGLIELIERNLAENDASGVEIVNRAIDYDPNRESVDLILGETTTGARLAEAGDSGARLERVPTTTLSRLLEAHGIGRYALVSDIEGAEAGIVFEDAAALARCDQAIVELHHTTWKGRALTPSDLADELETRHGLHVRASHGPVYFLER